MQAIFYPLCILHPPPIFFLMKCPLINQPTNMTPPHFSIQIHSSHPLHSQHFNHSSAKQRLPLLAPAKSRALTTTPHGTPAFLRPIFFSQTAYSNHSSAKRRPAFAPSELSHLPHEPRFLCNNLHSFLPTKCTPTNQPPNMAPPYLPPLCGAYPTSKHTIPLLTAGLPRSPHKCASLAVTKSDNIFPKTFIRQMRPVFFLFRHFYIHQ